MKVYCSNCGKQFNADACMFSVMETTFCSDECTVDFGIRYKKESKKS